MTKEGRYLEYSDAGKKILKLLKYNFILDLFAVFRKFLYILIIVEFHEYPILQ